MMLCHARADKYGYKSRLRNDMVWLEMACPVCGRELVHSHIGQPWDAYYYLAMMEDTMDGHVKHNHS